MALVVVFTLVGTAFSLTGAVCGGIAFYSTHRIHGDGPLLPGLTARIQVSRARLRRLLTRARPRTVALAGVASAATAGSARLTVTGPQIPKDADLHDQVKLLIHRVQNIEDQAKRDRGYINADLSEIRSRIDTVAASQEQASSAMQAKAKSMVLDTIGLQLLGLLFVGVGTVFLAAAAFAGL